MLATATPEERLEIFIAVMKKITPDDLWDRELVRMILKLARQGLVDELERQRAIRDYIG